MAGRPHTLPDDSHTRDFCLSACYWTSWNSVWTSCNWRSAHQHTPHFVRWHKLKITTWWPSEIISCVKASYFDEWHLIRKYRTVLILLMCLLEAREVFLTFVRFRNILGLYGTQRTELTPQSLSQTSNPPPPPFMEPEGSLPCTQEPATGLYPDPCDLSSYLPTI
jgi:hypothetical protein